MNSEVSDNVLRPLVMPTICTEMFGLQGPEAYAYTSSSNCLDVSDIDDIKDYSDTIVRCISYYLGRNTQLPLESYANHRPQCSRTKRDFPYACHRPMVGQRAIRREG